MMGQMADKRKLDLQETSTSLLNFWKEKQKEKKANEQMVSYSSYSQMIDTTTALGDSYLLWEPDLIAYGTYLTFREQQPGGK